MPYQHEKKVREWVWEHAAAIIIFSRFANYLQTSGNKFCKDKLFVCTSFQVLFCKNVSNFTSLPPSSSIRLWRQGWTYFVLSNKSFEYNNCIINNWRLRISKNEQIIMKINWLKNSELGSIISNLILSEIRTQFFYYDEKKVAQWQFIW